MFFSYLLCDGVMQQGHTELIENWKNNDNSKLWLDIEFDEHNINQAKQLLGELGCDAKLSENVFVNHHPAQLDQFEEQLFLSYRGVGHEIGQLRFEHQQLAFFIKERLLISLHRRPSQGTNAARNYPSLAEKIEHPLELALFIMRASSQYYLQNLLNFEASLEAYEDAHERGEGDQSLSDIAAHRIALLRLRRIFNYNRLMLSELKEVYAELEAKTASTSYALEELGDRFEHLYGLSNLYYDICSNLIEGHISISTHQQNMSMRLLTLITTIFVPLSFLTGIYGMNFDYMPELKHHYAYFYLLGAMLCLSSGLLVFFKFKKWF